VPRVRGRLEADATVTAYAGGRDVATASGTAAAMWGYSWHGALHDFFSLLAFATLAAACFMFARGFAALGERGWAPTTTTLKLHLLRNTLHPERADVAQQVE
jgi:hypothetical protein